MMRAVVMEINDSEGKTIILTDDGVFTTIDGCGFEVGQTIDYPAEAGHTADSSTSDGSSSPTTSPSVIRRKRFRRRNVIRAFAAAAACLAIASLGVLTFRPYAYASLDSNPSIRYTSNIFDQVLSVEAVDDDAEDIVKAVNGSGTWFRSLSDVITRTVDELYGAGYLGDTDENYLVIAVYSSDASRASELAWNLSDTLASLHDDLTVIGVDVDRSQQQEATELDTTAGKLYLVDQIDPNAGLSDNPTVTDLLDRTIPELMQTLGDKGIRLPEDVVHSSRSTAADSLTGPDVSAGSAGRNATSGSPAGGSARGGNPGTGDTPNLTGGDTGGNVIGTGSDGQGPSSPTTGSTSAYATGSQMPDASAGAQPGATATGTGTGGTGEGGGNGNGGVTNGGNVGGGAGGGTTDVAGTR